MKNSNESKSNVPADIEPVQGRKTTGTPINVYGLDGKFFKSFPTLQSAIKELGLTPSSLANCLNGKLRSHKGYQFRKA